MSGTRETSVQVAGHRIRLSNLDKVLYPAAGTTKRDVINYYFAVSSAMLPHIVDRPMTRKRWPNGVEAAPFFEKAIAAGAPSWVPQRTIKHTDRSVRYPLADSAAVLVWLAQLAALEIHVPQWTFGPRGRHNNPDRLVIDLDPGPGTSLIDCVDVAQHIRSTLGEHGAELVPVTSGSKGLHLYLGLNGTMTSEEASAWARHLAETVQAAMPKRVVSRMSKSERAGKVFIDWSQNNASKTSVAPYSLRGRPRPTVAAPRTWDELDDPAALDQLDFRQVLGRLEDRGDPMAHLGRAIDIEDPLGVYRAKRGRDRTPEPIPLASRPAGDLLIGTASNASKPPARARSGERGRGQTGSRSRASDRAMFVVQEHHARRLHWDFRLEHNGVLASWAVPKGVPTSGGANRLAVRTEDHPLEYATFEGTIPAGEYGGGEVSIWDNGEYSVEKWRDDEVIMHLNGSRARGRYALIQTDGKNWLLRRTNDQTPPDRTATSTPRGTSTPRATSTPRTRLADAAGAPLPRDVAPMLATVGTLDDIDGKGWQFEGKWDGMRAIVEIGDDGVRAHSRAGNDISDRFGELGELAAVLREHRAVLDGEIVALGDDGAPSFEKLQSRMGLTRRSDIQWAAAQVPAFFYAFDLVFLDGLTLKDKALRDRRALLTRLGIDTEHCSVPATLNGAAADALAESRRRHWEGVVAKRSASTYRPGVRSADWVKVKISVTQSVVIVGYRPGKGSRAGGIGSLLVAIPGDNGLEYAGRVGTGFTTAALARLGTQLAGLRRKTSAVASSVPTVDASDAVWVTPSLVGEVSAAELTSSGRLRQASWRGLRGDITPEDVRREL